MIPERLKDHLRRNYAMPDDVAVQLWEDLLAFCSETPQDYIRRRHLELQDQDMKNNEIFPLLEHEVRSALFPGPRLTLRQIRRIIYG